MIQDNTITNTVNHGISVRSSHNQILGNTITNAGTDWPYYAESSGIEVVRGNNSGDETITDVTIADNTISNSAFAGVRMGDFVEGVTIERNLITQTQHGGAGSTESGGAAININSSGATDTTIVRNSLTGNTGFGIFQRNSDGASFNNVAHENDISGNELGGVVNNDPSVLDATNNWWGAADGPSGEGSGTGDSVSTNVLFDPWGTSPGCYGVNTCDEVPTVSVDDVSVTEGTFGIVTANFTVTLSAPSAQTVTVDYATADGTAHAPGDYVSNDGTLTFAPGQTTQPVAVVVNGDMLNEDNETFLVNLANAANATISDAQGIGARS